MWRQGTATVDSEANGGSGGVPGLAIDGLAAAVGGNAGTPGAPAEPEAVQREDACVRVGARPRRWSPGCCSATAAPMAVWGATVLPARWDRKSVPAATAVTSAEGAHGAAQRRSSQERGRRPYWRGWHTGWRQRDGSDRERGSGWWVGGGAAGGALYTSARSMGFLRQARQATVAAGNPSSPPAGGVNPPTPVRPDRVCRLSAGAVIPRSPFPRPRRPRSSDCGPSPANGRGGVAI